MIRRLVGPVSGPIIFLVVAGLVFAGLGWVTVAALGVDDGRTISHLRRLLEARIEVPAEVLADPATDLRRLARPPAPG